MYRVVIVEPESPGNIGFIARVCENFSIDELVLVNPQCDIDTTAKDRAVHAQETLRQARTPKTLDEAIADVDVAIGTTGVKVSDDNIERNGIPPREAFQNARDADVALVFGREGTGLTNTELDACDFVMHIPTAAQYSVMNLSHAVAVICYEAFVQRNKVHETVEQEQYASREQREALENLFKGVTERLDWTDQRQENMLRVFRNLLGRAYLTDPERAQLFGLFRTIRDTLDN